jgi:hypothetical protein
MPPPPTTTQAYEAFWRFAAARQEAFFARIENPQRGIWSADPILQRFNFTNCYRVLDRTSQYLIREVIYKGDQSTDEIFFRTLLFKIFNRIETWEMLTAHLGEISWRDFNRPRAEALLQAAMAAGDTIFSSAYIMPTRSGDLSSHVKHVNFLTLLERMMLDQLPQRLAQLQSLHAVYLHLVSYPLLGSFLAFQLTIDLLYSTMLPWSEDDFVVAGPGAISGITKCFSDTRGMTPAELIRWTATRQEEEFERRGLAFQSLWGRRLHLIDIQNLFCEVNKYCRVAHPEIAGADGRTQIKQQFRPRRDVPSFWFPPKWGINDRVPQSETSDGPHRVPIQKSLF